MKTLLLNSNEFKEYKYAYEKDFEADVVNNAQKIFGKKTIYVDVKKLLNDKYKKNRTIPDGYLLDYTTESKPRLYLVENELSVHPVREHIADQLLKFAYSYKNDFVKIKEIIIREITDKGVDIDKIANNANYRNADDMFSNILNIRLGVIIIIDEITDELIELKGIFNFDIELLEFKRFCYANDVIFHYDKFYDDSYDANGDIAGEKQLDTMLVAAEEPGFESAFLENNCWYPVAISINMLDKIKYIAVYRKNPIKAITHYAEVAKIDLYENTGKYVLYFKGEGKKLERPIPIDSKNPYRTPRGRVYTNIDKILNADKNTTVADLY